MYRVAEWFEVVITSTVTRCVGSWVAGKAEVGGYILPTASTSPQVHSNGRQHAHVNLVTTSTFPNALLPKSQVYDIRWWESPGSQITIHSSRSRTSTECSVRDEEMCTSSLTCNPEALLDRSGSNSAALSTQCPSCRSFVKAIRAIRGGNLSSNLIRISGSIRSVRLDDHINPFHKKVNLCTRQKSVHQSRDKQQQRDKLSGMGRDRRRTRLIGSCESTISFFKLHAESA